MGRQFEVTFSGELSPNSVSIVEAANYQIFRGLINLHNPVLRKGNSREIHTALAILQAVRLTPEEARSVAETWKELPALMRELDPSPFFGKLIEKILAELASR